MTCGALAVAVLAAVVVQAPGTASEKEKLQRLRRLGPEDLASFKERLAEFKRLPPIEQQRLRDNLAKLKALTPEQVSHLRKKVMCLTDEEKKGFVDLAGSFFRWGRMHGLHQNFPRRLFFTWLKVEKPEEIERIRRMDGSVGGPRRDAFVRLYVEFRNRILARAERHSRQHRCADAEDIRALRDAPPDEVWPRIAEFRRRCQGGQTPGPVPPDPATGGPKR